ncbi:uncharacterized protein LOC135377709 [Ornithodoros turicata]|uniref:uncharacterized protein LOC135377709 n=1 Tax=Ornithodoros turicata TaxID=34597 RepID=UPI0031398B21
MPDLSKGIKDFNGEGDSSLARDWIENLRSTAALHKWPEEFQLETAKSHLNGAALDWYRSRRSKMTSWKEFEERFTRTFISQANAAEKFRRMKERVQQRNESTVAYFHAKIRLCTEANLDFCITREQVLVGLRSRQLCSPLMARVHDDEDDLLHDIQEFERVERERDERFGAVLKKPTQDNELRSAEAKDGKDVQPQSGGRVVSTGKDLRPPLRNEEGDPKCYNCNEYGHVARDCSRPKRALLCLRCGKTGHTQRHCSDFVKRNETNVVGKPSEDVQQPQVLLKKVRWNGKANLVGMIDTGSSGCLLRKSAAECCGAEVQLEAAPLYGFGNSAVPATRTIGKCTADLEIDGVVGKNVSVLVVPDQAQTVDLLVGRTFTELPYITYARIGGVLRFWHRDDCPFSHLEPDQVNTQLRLKAKKDELLQEGTVNWITLTADENLSGEVSYRQCGEEYFIDMQQGEIKVPVVCTERGGTKIRRGQRMGKAVLFEPDQSGDSGESPCTDFNPAEEGTSASDTLLVTERRLIDLGEVKVGPIVDEQQKAELVDLLNEYRQCFAMIPEELGCTNVLEMKIEEIPGSTPVAVRPYRASAIEREMIRKIVTEWKRLGIVTETHSPYASPVLLIGKKNGEQRLVVDY